MPAVYLNNVNFFQNCRQIHSIMLLKTRFRAAPHGFGHLTSMKTNYEAFTDVDPVRWSKTTVTREENLGQSSPFQLLESVSKTIAHIIKQTTEQKKQVVSRR